MSLAELLATASDKKNFTRLEHYSDFAARCLDFQTGGLQAVIVSQNERNYRFWQYRDDGHDNITRPINADLMYDAGSAAVLTQEFRGLLANVRDLSADLAGREKLNRSIYTLQQCVGATLDALPAGQSNKARKIQGDLFERLIALVLKEIGLQCRSGVVAVPVPVSGGESLSMMYQHDLIVEPACRVMRGSPSWRSGLPSSRC